MENRQLIINGEQVDFFSDDEPVPLVLQINNLNDLQSLQNNYTKSFKLPNTQKVRRILGFPDDITITTNIPYQQSAAKYIVEGIEIIANGLAEIIDVQDNYINVTVLSGNCGFLDSLGGQLYDMGDSTTIWSGYGTNLVWNKYNMPFPNDPGNLANCIWDVKHAAYSQKKTSGWIWPIVNYGGISIIPPFNGYINVRNQRPGFFLHTAIELLVESTGYSIDYNKSSMVKDPLYQKLIVQFSNSDFQHGTDFQNTPDNLGATYMNGQDQIISNPRVSNRPSSDIHLSDYPFSGVINFGPSDHYSATTNVNLTATILFNLYLRGKLTGTPSECIIKFTLIDTDGSFIDFASYSFTLNASDPNYRRLHGSGSSVVGEETFNNIKITQDFSLVTGQKLYVRYHINNLGQGADDTYVIFRSGASFSVITNEQLVLWQQPIQCERIFPDVSQLDLLKDTLQHFGMLLIADPNTATIIFISFKDIVANIPIAKDWSFKALDMGKQVSFKLGNYSQVNWMRYQQDNAIPLNYMPKYFADDHIDITDKTLTPNQPVAVLFTSLFGPTLNSPYIGGSIAQISDPTLPDSFSVGNQPRLLVDQKLDISQMGPGGSPLTVIFSDNDIGFETETVHINDVISVPYFYKPGGEYNLCFCDKGGQQGLRSKYYQEFEHVLKQAKVVTRYFYLTPLDIQEFDFTIPIYLRQDGCYFYVTKVDSWIKGQPTKVDLVRL